MRYTTCILTGRNAASHSKCSTPRTDTRKPDTPNERYDLDNGRLAGYTACWTRSCTGTRCSCFKTVLVVVLWFRTWTRLRFILVCGNGCYGFRFTCGRGGSARVYGTTRNRLLCVLSNIALLGSFGTLASRTAWSMSTIIRSYGTNAPPAFDSRPDRPCLLIHC